MSALEEACPAVLGEGGPHGWMPLAVVGAFHEFEPTPGIMHCIKVYEVCPHCRTFRVVLYSSQPSDPQEPGVTSG